MVDEVISGQRRDFRKYASYYTESDSILQYMIEELDIEVNNNILEPCAGNGDFVDAIINKDLNNNIDCYDLNIKAFEVLRDKYKAFDNIKIYNDDTLLSEELDLIEGKKYHKVIGNPPYGAWQSEDKKKMLKNKYKDYVKESYTLFLRRCLNLLKKDGRLVFIIPDTFLVLNMHKKLRTQILEEYSIKNILQFPSKFFPGVNFGYSGMCIVCIDKTIPNKDSSINIHTIEKDKNKLKRIIKEGYSVCDTSYSLNQLDVLNKMPNSIIQLKPDKEITNLILETELKVGDIAKCVTGFYSGDNKKFIVPRIKIDEKTIYGSVLEEEIINGVSSPKNYIPILKSKSFLTPNIENYIRWKPSDIDFFKTDKKARFQNSKYYFKNGIGIPMVKSKKIEAFLLEKNLFDQSIVGIFCNDEKYTKYLAAYLNSSIFNKLIHSINHTSNNSANYIKQIPFKKPLNGVEEVNEIVDNYLNSKVSKEETQILIDRYFSDLFATPPKLNPHPPNHLPEKIVSRLSPVVSI